MRDLADKLMGRRRNNGGSNLETAIFGSASSLAEAIDTGVDHQVARTSPAFEPEFRLEQAVVYSDQSPSLEVSG